MNIKVEDLEQKGYVMHSRLEHEELVPFVQDIFRNSNVITKSFMWLNIILVAFLAYLITREVMTGSSIWHILGQLGWGILLVLPIIPIHEAIHGAAYKWIGASKVHYTANFRKFYFTAQADRFVVGEKEFYPLAFAPFVVINILTIVLMILLPQEFLLMLASFLFFHTTSCGGDFALAAYFYNHRDQGLVTYDDVPNKETYFYIKNSENE